MNRIRIGLMSCFAYRNWYRHSHKILPVQQAFSIKQAIDYAHQHNAQVKNALLDLKIQIQNNRATAAGALPTISGTANSTYFLRYSRSNVFQTLFHRLPMAFFNRKE